MVIFRLARLNPQRDRIWGVNMGWFVNKHHQILLLDLRCEVILTKHEKLGLEAFTNLHSPTPQTWSNFLTLAFGGGLVSSLSPTIFLWIGLLCFTKKGPDVLMTFWDNEYYTFISWDKARDKFNLTPIDAEDWISLNHNHDVRPMVAPSWIWPRSYTPWPMDCFYVDEGEDPAFVLQYSTEFPHTIVLCLSMLYATCLAPISYCLSESVNPTRGFVGYFHEVRIIRTTRWQTKHKITFFYGKTAILKWDLDRWQWVEATGS